MAAKRRYARVRDPSQHSLLAVSDAAWAEAVRREAVIRPLVAMTPLGNAAVARAARDLGLSMSRIYALVRSFRDEPVTSSLLCAMPGPQRGKRNLPFAVEAKIEEAIEAVYL